MEKIYRIPSGLYFELFSKGGDRLVSVFSILKTSKGSDIKYYAFTSENNKVVSGYSLLRNKTNLTLHSLKKYVPVLIEMGLCKFDANGNFVLLGNDKLKRKFKSIKLVPILIGKNIVHTSYNVMAVRLHSLETKQLRQIEIKRNQRVLLKRKDNPRNLEELKAIKSIEKNRKKDDFFIDNCVLSLPNYAYLKDNSQSKSKGSYWKSKLQQKNIITTRRRFEKIAEMSFNNYLSLRSNHELSNQLTYKNGWLVKEVVSEFKVINSQCKLLTPTFANQSQPN